MRAKLFAIGIALTAAAVFSGTARATPSDQLAACLVTHTNDADRVLLVKWIFAQFALAPDVAPMTRISVGDRDKLNKDTASLFTRLLTSDCTEQARVAFQVDGGTAFEAAFQVLGQAAARGLMLNPKVHAGTAEFAKYLDSAKLKSVLGETVPAAAGANGTK